MLTSLGLFRLLAGTFENNAAATLEAMEMEAGIWNGSAGATVGGKADITGGTINGARIITLNNATELCTIEGLSLSEAQIASSAAVQTRANINLNDGGSLSAEAAWTFDQGVDVLGATGSFSVQGTGQLTVKPGQSRVTSVFNNDGLTTVQDGATLELEGGGEHDGDFMIDAGGVLELARKAMLFNSGADITGGKLSLPAGNSNQKVKVHSTFNVNELDMGSHELELAAGGALIANTLIHSTGEITGAGMATINGTATLKNGSWSGTGTTTFNETTTLLEIGDMTFDQRTIDFRGPTAISPGSFANLRGGRGAKLNIHDTFTVSGNTDFIATWTGLPAAELNIKSGGTFERTGGTSTSDITADVTVEGTLRLSNTQGLTRFSRKLQITTGAIELQDSDISVNQSLDLLGGVLRGAGVIHGDVDCNAGSVSPGIGTGQLMLNGSATFASGGNLDIDLEGTTAGQFDVLDVSGTANIGGTLRINRLNQFQPTLGDSFAIVTATAVNGQFDSAEAPTPDKPYRFYKIAYSSASVTATYQTATQYSEWTQANFTAAEMANASISGPGADPDGDGLTNFVEYALGLDPRTQSTSPISFELIENGTKATITFPLLAGATDIGIRLDQSTDLQQWTPASPAQTMSAIDSELNQVTLTVDLTGNPNELFLRLGFERE